METMESEASPRIARELLQLILADIVFTDVQIKPGQRLAYRAPRGYEMLQSSPVAAEDIRIFADFATASGRASSNSATDSSIQRYR